MSHASSLPPSAKTGKGSPGSEALGVLRAGLVLGRGLEAGQKYSLYFSLHSGIYLPCARDFRPSGVVSWINEQCFGGGFSASRPIFSLRCIRHNKRLNASLRNYLRFTPWLILLKIAISQANENVLEVDGRPYFVFSFGKVPSRNKKQQFSTTLLRTAAYMHICSSILLQVQNVVITNLFNFYRPLSSSMCLSSFATSLSKSISSRTSTSPCHYLSLPFSPPLFLSL